MPIRPFFLLLVATLLLPLASQAQKAAAVTDYLRVAGPLTVAGKTHRLAWSAHPLGNYYKQEYLPAGEAAASYRTMVLLELSAGPQTVQQVLQAKVAELEGLKAGNPLVNYEVLTNPKTGEAVLDFLLSASAPNGSLSIVERNVYRYQLAPGSPGKPGGGVVLYGISTRGYGAGIDPFLQELKAGRAQLRDEMARAPLPRLTVPRMGK